MKGLDHVWKKTRGSTAFTPAALVAAALTIGGAVWLAPGVIAWWAGAYPALKWCLGSIVLLLGAWRAQVALVRRRAAWRAAEDVRKARETEALGRQVADAAAARQRSRVAKIREDAAPAEWIGIGGPAENLAKLPHVRAGQPEHALATTMILEMHPLKDLAAVTYSDAPLRGRVGILWGRHLEEALRELSSTEAATVNEAFETFREARIELFAGREPSVRHVYLGADARDGTTGHRTLYAQVDKLTHPERPTVYWVTHTARPPSTPASAGSKPS